MPTDEEVIREGMIEKFCETHGVERDSITPEGEELIIERLRIMKEAREKFQFLFRHDPNAPEPPGQLDYLTFMLDELCPPNTDRRLRLDVKFAQMNLDLAVKGIEEMEEARKPKLVIPGVGETAQVNEEKN